MYPTTSASTGGPDLTWVLRPYQDLLDFRAPYLEEKLVARAVVRTRDEARLLFRELKRWIVLSELHPQRSIPMFSSRVDEAWHQFVLFTREYERFCQRFTARFIHHTPAEAPELPPAELTDSMSYEHFCERYVELFGPVSEQWRDELWLSPGSRLHWAGWADRRQVVAQQDGKVSLLIGDDPPTTVCRTSARAHDALQFIASASPFLVRELPGLRSAEEQLLLCRPLVELRALQLAL